MYKPMLFLVVLLVSGTVSQQCPGNLTAEDVLPCECQDGGKLYCRGSLAVKPYFEKLSNMIDSDFVFEELYLALTEETEFPEGMTQNLKFKTMTIQENYDLTFIHPDAFSGTYDVTTNISLFSNTNLWGNTTNETIFGFIQRFPNLNYFHPSLERTPISSEHVFTHPELTYLYFSTGSQGIEKLTSGFFSGMPKLNRLTLALVGLDDGDFDVGCFDGLPAGVEVRLGFNTFTTMPEEIFKPLLDTAAEVYVGGSICGIFGCVYEYLECNEEVEYICKHATEYLPKLHGYKCVNRLYDDIWDYCARKYL